MTGDDSDQTIAAMQQRLNDSIDKGLRATLKTGSLLTGSLYISLDFIDKPSPAGPRQLAGYPVLPTTSGGFDQIQNKITQMLDTLNALPLKETLHSADDTLTSISSAAQRADQTLVSLDQLLKADATRQLPEQLRSTLESLREDLRGLVGDFSSGSPFYRKLNTNLDQLQKTLHSVDQLSTQLSTQPSELIFLIRYPTILRQENRYENCPQSCFCLDHGYAARCLQPPSAPKTHYYLIASKEQSVKPLSMPPVIYTECAPFLSQGGLVMEYPNQTIQTAHYHHWAEPLPAMITRYLQRRLQMSLDAASAPPVITLLVDRFHRLNTGEVVFSGQWWANNEPPQSFSYKMQNTDNSYETTVSELQRLLDQQNDTMVQTLSPHTLAHTEAP